MDEQAVMVSPKWFPAAHLDHYVASPLDMKLFATGPLFDIHKYRWINEARGSLKKGTDAYYLTSDFNYSFPENYKNDFSTIMSPDTILIERAGKVANRFYLYRLKDYHWSDDLKSSHQ